MPGGERLMEGRPDVSWIEFEEVSDGLPLWGAVTLGLSAVLTAALTGVLLGLVVLAL